MVLFLARKNDWTLVSDVFKHANDDGANPEGITSLSGARKALREIEYVELANVTPTGRPNYRCRIKPTIEAFKNVMLAIPHGSQREFMRSQYYRNWIPKLSHQFNQVISTYETLTDVGLDALNRINKQRLRDYGVDSASELIMKIFTDEDLRDSFDLKRYTIDVMNIYNNPDFNETGRLALNNDELNVLESSLKHNWLALKYVVSFLLADPQMQHQMYVNMIRDSKNVLTLTDGDWILFFNQLDQLNFNYGFLFD